VSTEAFLSLVALAFATLWTPGPNNILLASSGASFGFRRSVPHMLGIIIGFPLMVLGVGFFLGQVFQSGTVLRDIIRWAGALLMLWIAWKIASAGGLSTGNGRARPMRFHEAAAFQWVNPKAWAMIVAVTSQFVTGENSATVIPFIALVFATISLSSTTTWVGFGTAMTRWLKTQGRLVWFNRAMAALILASVAMLFFE
jgi:threonine/homoserine/homoserine lactone efflux protein